MVSIDDVNKYHKKVIDKNDTPAGDNEKIFADSNDINTQYAACVVTRYRRYFSYVCGC